jgi:hypothetical protein
MTITNDEIAVPAARTQRWRRADAPTVALHWLVAGLLLVSLATGFRVASEALDAGGSHSVAAAVAPQGAVHVWHIASACALIAAVSAYAMFLTRARQFERVRLDAGRLRELHPPFHRKRWRSANVLIYWLAA